MRQGLLFLFFCVSLRTFAANDDKESTIFAGVDSMKDIRSKGNCVTLLHGDFLSTRCKYDAAAQCNDSRRARRPMILKRSFPPS